MIYVAKSAYLLQFQEFASILYVGFSFDMGWISSAHFYFHFKNLILILHHISVDNFSIIIEVR